MNEFVKLAIWAVVIAVVFAILWRKGALLRIRNYVVETREELRKCSWPSKQELKGSTGVVLVAVAMLGLFTMVVDFVISQLMRLIT